MDCSVEKMDDPNDFADPSQMESLLKDWPMQVKLVINFISTLSSFQVAQFVYNSRLKNL